ncbi:unnamed protein product [Miscanthus lutarioriparius]|uniref:Uncharacterized protein n=1 Tax=Miscanthus lutarioriparius TaxID=422564 RepID=A0A811PVC0_9POAL|nr:unnamed protein product [Miscanthus lutarioriparius]
MDNVMIGRVDRPVDTTIDERMAKATEKLEADFAKVGTKMSRFPHEMRGIGGGHRYIAPIVASILGQDGSFFVEPSVVAIGPYHHGAPHLQKMEEVKLAAAYNLCRSSGHSTAEVYGKVLSVAGAARDCYDTDDPAVMGVNDADFATMMFLDGCFLLEYMVAGDTNEMIRRQIMSMGTSIQKDIFLLENQIPGWEASSRRGQSAGVAVAMATLTLTTTSTSRRISLASSASLCSAACLRRRRRSTTTALSWTSRCCRGARSATELAQIGVALTPSTAPWFGDIRFRWRHRVLGKLSLSPVFLNHFTACCLVNMAAFETIYTDEEATKEPDGFAVSSYLSVLAMLMDEMRDVQELRQRHLLHGSMSDIQALVFFKALLEQIGTYMRRRSLAILVYQFVYLNYYQIATAIISITNSH